MLKSAAMKPNFTLSLSFDGIRLLHRVSDGWRLIGEVTLDSDDLVAELSVLRKTATALEPGGLRSLLLIPDSQIRYLTIDTPGMDPAARRVAAAAALEGATPYAVDELVYHVSADGPCTYVAAVARETLEEAEAFAVEHRFYPVAYTAAPSEHPYHGAPDFGPTAAAQALLEPGETIEPEKTPVKALPVTSAPKGPVVASGDAAALHDADSSQDVKSLDPAPLPSSNEPSKPEQTDAEGTSETGAEEKPVAKAEAAPEDAADPAPVQVDIPSETATETPISPSERPAPKSGSVAASAAPLAAAAIDDEGETPARSVTFAAPAAQRSTTGFASVRAAEAKPAERAPSLGGASRATPPLPAPKPEPAPAQNAPAASSATVPRAAPSPAAAPLVPPMPVDAAVELPHTSAAPPATPEPDSSSLNPESQPAGAGFLSRRKPKNKKARAGRRLTPAALAQPVPANEAERMTIFGARRSDTVGGKPQFLGLILTAALLVFLAGVAAWASIFLDNDSALSRLFGDRSPRSTAEVTAPVAPSPQVPTDEIAVLPPEPAGPDPIETAALDAGLTDEDGAVLDALRDPEPRPSTEMTEAEIDAKYATTGIWPRAPQVPPAPAAAIDIEDLYLTSIDPISTSTDAVALPAVDRFATDAAPDAVATPAAAGTKFDLDPRGLVTPTAKGALSPDGHLVYLGRPAAVPPTTLAKREVVPVTLAADMGLTEARPLTRPDDLSETNERAQLDGLTRAELAGLRPKLRPQSAQEAAAEALAAAVPAAADPVVTPIDTSDAVAAALAAPPAIENATKQATKQSRRPDIRPNNFSRIVQRAESQPAPTAAQVASIAPRAVQPKIPSKTSVAKQATSKNAINLRKINLIGVYGKPSSRRALVRLSNGRYQKVEVGDRIDGGRVAAIGDDQLRYVKRGRNYVLKMPN